MAVVVASEPEALAVCAAHRRQDVDPGRDVLKGFEDPSLSVDQAMEKLEASFTTGH